MNKERFTPLETRSRRRLTAAFGSLSLTGFTLLELLIVIVVVGILATLAVIQYQPYKENTLDREAQANLKLIWAAQVVYEPNTDNQVYFTPSDNTNVGINSGLNLQLPTTTSNWNYTMVNCTSSGYSRFSAKATRTDGSRSWCIKSRDPLHPNTNDPVPVQTADCNCPN